MSCKESFYSEGLVLIRCDFCITTTLLAIVDWIGKNTCVEAQAMVSPALCFSDLDQFHLSDGHSHVQGPESHIKS